MLDRLPDGKCSRWNDLWSHSLYYTEQCEGCKSIVQIGRRKFCGETETHVTLHQVIRSQIGCTWCKHYTKRLDSAVCLRCLEEHPDAKPFSMTTIPEEELERWKRDKYYHV